MTHAHAPGKDLAEANDVALTFATLFGHNNNYVMIQIDNDDDNVPEHIHITCINYAGAKPLITECPDNITLYTEFGGNISVTWPTPSASSPCPDLAPVKTKQSHHPGDVFREGTVTEVRYEFLQYDQDDNATCSFYIHILSGKLISCQFLSKLHVI